MTEDKLYDGVADWRTAIARLRPADQKAQALRPQERARRELMAYLVQIDMNAPDRPKGVLTGIE